MSIQAQGNLYWLTVGRNRAVGLGLGLGTASGRRVRGRTEVSEAEVVEECRGHLAGDRLLQHRLHVPGVDHRGGLLPERELRHRPTDHAGRRCSSGVLFNGAVHQQEVVPRPERAQREPQRPGDRQPPSELRPPHRHGPEQPCRATAAAAAAIPITTVNIYVATASPPCRHRRRHTTRARDCNPASITVATQCGVAIRSKGGAAEPGTSRAFFCQTPSTASQSSGHPGSDYGDNTLVLSSLQGPLSIATQSAVACAFGQYQPYS